MMIDHRPAKLSTMLITCCDAPYLVFGCMWEDYAPKVSPEYVDNGKMKPFLPHILALCHPVASWPQEAWPWKSRTKTSLLLQVWKCFSSKSTFFFSFLSTKKLEMVVLQEQLIWSKFGGGSIYQASSYI
jgi:hypothetical protein